MRTYQARFYVDYTLRILQCLQGEARIADGRYAALHFEDCIQLLRLVREAGQNRTSLLVLTALKPKDR